MSIQNATCPAIASASLERHPKGNAWNSSGLRRGKIGFHCASTRTHTPKDTCEVANPPKTLGLRVFICLGDRNRLPHPAFPPGPQETDSTVPQRRRLKQPEVSSSSRNPFLCSAAMCFLEVGPLCGGPSKKGRQRANHFDLGISDPPLNVTNF